MKLCSIQRWIFVVLGLLGINGLAATLGIQGTSFTIDGCPTFLLGISYYGGCGAPPKILYRDLDALRRHGFHWIRVWATWDGCGANVSAIGPDGAPREPYWSRLLDLVRAADVRGMIVDVTLTRGSLLPNQQVHLRAVRALARGLKPFRNVYFDIANERNIRDARFVSYQELRELREAIRAIDPDRLVTASHAGDLTQEQLRQYLKEVRVDFVAPHRPRRSGSAEQTAQKVRQWLAWMQRLGKVVPVHLQEPFRRDYGRWQPGERDFLVDLTGAIRGGAAGWCFHNGSPRWTGRSQTGPCRSFDLRRQGLLEQLDRVEQRVVRQVGQIVKKEWRGGTSKKTKEGKGSVQ